MTISWTDTEKRQHTLPRLIKSIIDPEDPSIGVQQTLELVDLLILSNHIHEAHEILCDVYNLAENTDKEPIPTSLSRDIFWHVHRDTLQLPSADFKLEYPPESLAREQWGKYRECTRTGWMLDRHGLAEPENASVWRETDDPVLLAMCSRLLAKTLSPGTYPSESKAEESLEAALKLFAIPETNLTEWRDRAPPRPPRHAYLLYRRLPVELAIRLGKYQTAADILSQGLQNDGFMNGGELWDYLNVPGIFDVLPLLSERENPFSIEKTSAQTMVQEIKSAFQLRSREGRQWALAESKVSWRELLDRLADGAWKTHEEEYRQQGVNSAKEILCDPATEEDIEAAEAEVGELPSDFKEMLRLANGFKGCWHLFGGGISGITNIHISEESPEDTLFDYDGDMLEEMEPNDESLHTIKLEPGTDCDSFGHYIIPPAYWSYLKKGKVQEGEYRYFHWAFWQGEAQEWKSIRDYVASCVEEVENELEQEADGIAHG